MPENKYDPIPTMAAAISAYKKSGGNPKSETYKAYQDAIANISRNYGQEAATQTQFLASNVAGNNGDVNASLSRFAKDALAGKQTMHPAVKDFLVVADQNPRLLDKFTYGFNLPDQSTATTDILQRVKNVINR